MRREVVIATLAGGIATVVLAVLIVIGSRRLSHFDAALVGYTFATLFALFGITYRYAIWLQRPPTWLYWKRGWQIFLDPRHLPRNLVVWLGRLTNAFVLNRFIWRRSLARGAAHWLILWGCILAAAITFPLVFGWIHFTLDQNDFEHYRIVIFGFETAAFPVESLGGMLIFHGLVWSAFLVIAGVMLAMRRRMRDRDAAAMQQFGEDIMPLVLAATVRLPLLEMPPTESVAELPVITLCCLRLRVATHRAVYQPLHSRGSTVRIAVFGRAFSTWLISSVDPQVCSVMHLAVGRSTRLGDCCLGFRPRLATNRTNPGYTLVRPRTAQPKPRS